MSVRAQRRVRPRPFFDLYQQGNAAGDAREGFFQRGDAAAVGQGEGAQLRKRQRVHTLPAPAEALKRGVVKDDRFAVSAEAHIQFDAYPSLAGAFECREAVF